MEELGWQLSRQAKLPALLCWEGSLSCSSHTHCFPVADGSYFSGALGWIVSLAEFSGAFNRPQVPSLGILGLAL